MGFTWTASNYSTQWSVSLLLVACVPKGGGTLESNCLFPAAGCDGSRPFRPPHKSATRSHFAGTPPPKVGAQTRVVKNPCRPPKSRRTAQMNIDHVHPEARVACVGRTNATCGIPPWVSLKSQNHYTTSIYVTSPHAWRTSTPTTTCFLIFSFACWHVAQSYQ